MVKDSPLPFERQLDPARRMVVGERGSESETFLAEAQAREKGPTQIEEHENGESQNDPALMVEELEAMNGKIGVQYRQEEHTDAEWLDSRARNAYVMSDAIAVDALGGTEKQLVAHHSQDDNTNAEQWIPWQKTSHRKSEIDTAAVQNDVAWVK